MERPDPDALLARVQHEERATAQGQLKIFFGAAPGVGKTYAMLSEAREKQAAGADVVVGIVESHGRAETEALLEGLEVLSCREITYHGVRLREFDLDAALQRRPALLLTDELAHTNAPDSRHTRRWQDVEELLAAGVDIFTTVNRTFAQCEQYYCRQIHAATLACHDLRIQGRCIGARERRYRCLCYQRKA